MSVSASPPILTCEQTRALEERRFRGNEAAEWQAMRSAGEALAAAVLRDSEECGGFPAAGRVLVLVGKGHNGGDALIAAREILRRFPGAQAAVVFAFGERPLRPLAQRAWRELAETGQGRVASGRAEGQPSFDLSLDGVFGFQFRPPLPPEAARVLRWANALPVRVRAAVDLPSGLDEADGFRADFTYATGIVKTPLLGCRNAGRIRYLDLGFFDEAGPETSADCVLGSGLLAPLAGLRPAATDKRTFGHLLVVGGSLGYPGAVLMAVKAALRSGVGLLTAFVPASLVPAYAAAVPEAMWVAWPEARGGGLALRGKSLLQKRLERGTALLMGPGMGRERETLALMKAIVKTVAIPTLLDADALQPEVIKAARPPLVLTPHAGEFIRIAGKADLRTFVVKSGAAVVKKGPVTEVALGGASPGAGSGQLLVYHSFFGGPVLARGGSGDVLAGLVGGLLAQTPDDRLLAACRGVVWHGLAADALARARGQVAVTTTQLLDYLPAVLRGQL